MAVKTHPAAWMIIPTFTPVVGGAQVQVQQLSEALLAQAWEVQVLTRQHSYAHPEGLPAFEMVRGLPVRRLYSRGGSKLGGVLYILGGLWHLARCGRGQIYHAHDAGAAGWLAVAARYLLGGRCLIKLRTGANAYQGSLGSGLARWQFLTLLRLADRILVVNQDVERFVRELGIPAERVVCIPNGVDPRRYCPASLEERAAARRKLNLKAQETAVLYVGRLEHMKGVDILLRGWERMLDDLAEPARLILVGDGPERAHLTRLAEELQIKDSVTFVGERSEVRDFYWAADIFALPSRTEGLSNALLEAMACGLPVVASRVGGAKDLVVEWQNGFFFEPEAVDELARKLCLLLVDRKLQSRLGAEGRRNVMDYAGLPMVVRRLNEVYEELAG